jgi:Na+/proline symporter
MTKKILISGLVGTLVYFFLGWLVYGIILTESTTGEESMLFIFLGCLFFSFIFSYVFVSLTAISHFKEGFSAGLVIGLLHVLSWYFFMNMEFDLNEFLQEVVIGTLMTAILAVVVAFVNGKID